MVFILECRLRELEVISLGFPPFIAGERFDKCKNGGLPGLAVKSAFEIQQHRDESKQCMSGRSMFKTQYRHQHCLAAVIVE